MRHIENDVSCFNVVEDFVPHVMRLCDLIRGHPQIIKPVRGMDDEIKRICEENALLFYPTVRDTTILYDIKSDCFFKILHPATLADRLKSLFKERAEEIYNLSGKLRREGIRVAEVVAYGRMKDEGKPVYMMKRISGRSIYDIVIRGGERIEFGIYQKVIDEVAKLHILGYWLGDAHVSHIFIDESEVSGFIDIDSIRRNGSFSIKKMAKDIAGLNYPGIPIMDKEKQLLLEHYIKTVNITDKEGFLRFLKIYIKKRWG